MASVVLDGAEEGLEALLEPRYTNIRTGRPESPPQGSKRMRDCPS
jgi:hypothetical protein